MLQNSLFSFRKEKQLISSKQYEDIEKKIVNDAEIVLTTLASSGNDRLLNKIRG